jgi:uncharacterized Zn finger protein
MKQGHVTGSKSETQGATDWYKAIEAANIQAVEDAERTLTTALAHQVGNAVAAMPEAATRITKAAQMVQRRDVWPMTDGTFLVGSSSDTVKAYLVTRGPWTCDCPDHTQRQHLCKHAIAAMLTVKLGTTYQPTYH